MAIFAKDASAAGETKASVGGEGSLSVIAAGMTITGDIDTEGVVKIEGKVEGSVRAGRQVLIGRQGEIHGDVNTREAVVGGKVQGTVTATERVEIQATASVVGDINTKAITVVEGGKINGAVRISDAAPVQARGEQREHREQRDQREARENRGQPIAAVR